MRPIGQYPTVAEYKSVGLTPPTRSAIKRAFKAMMRTKGESGEAVVTDSSAPMSPAAEDAIISDLRGSKAVSEPLLGIPEYDCMEGPVEAAAREGEADELPASSLEMPVFEVTRPHIGGNSLSPIETPVATPGDDLSSDLPLPAPGTLLSGPIAEVTSSHQAAATSLTGDMDTEMMPALVPRPDGPVFRDFLAVLESLPAPTSDYYDVAQLKQVMTSSIAHSSEAGQDEIAMTLLHFWSGIAGDDFKLSLVHNLGLKEVDPDLELALKTTLCRSTHEASEWYKAYVAKLPAATTQRGPGSDSGLSSAQSVEADRGGQTFKAADIYRDTSGPRLEDLFNAGRTNTAPLKRPKKPCPVNEKSFKRRREWESDPSLDQTLREKRARLMEHTAPDPALVKPDWSSIRPQRDEPILAEQTSCSVAPRETTTADQVTESVEPLSEPVPARGQRGSRGRGRGRGRGGRAISTRSQRTQEPQEQTEPQVDSPSTVACAVPPQVLGKRPRELSLDTTVSAESELSNECYSERENEWHGEFGDRQMPNSIEPPENSDNCYECDQVGNLLCCDTCENAFHFECLRPRQDPKNPPRGEWYCPRCAVRNPLTTAIAHGRHKKRKTEFDLPDEIKGYFTGVETGQISDAPILQDIKNMRFYKAVPHIPRLTKPPRAGTRATPAYDDPNLLKMTENGQLILCNRCGRSTENTRPIIRCDYCPSHFHLDCLDPPLAHPPNPRNGWMCPKHVLPDELLVTKMVDGKMQERRPRRPKHTVATVDVEPAPYEDVNETTFDDDFREKRHLLPAGDIVLDFISAVRHDSSRQQQDFFAGLTQTCLAYARSLVEERLAQSSNQASREEYDAAVALMGFARGDDAHASVDGTSPQST
ncbi:hypothetical protein PDE_07814 [Penicillium oxalicum 114-2]|uniref:PHD-type domain-containing protein n=1 Tax=Penicillium oxalicum (strain 114-2 / CGMCC 5302) TaxID=933388 RepID=S8B221_PENO1|nr:hypothetical protein PDE_07814 [Penicillium oxalicum 114-2]